MGCAEMLGVHFSTGVGEGGGDTLILPRNPGYGDFVPGYTCFFFATAFLVVEHTYLPKVTLWECEVNVERWKWPWGPRGEFLP